MKVSADTLDAFLSGEQGLYYGDTADAADVQAQMTGRYRAVRRAVAGVSLHAPECLVNYTKGLKKRNGLRRAVPVVSFE